MEKNSRMSQKIGECTTLCHVRTGRRATRSRSRVACGAQQAEDAADRAALETRRARSPSRSLRSLRDRLLENSRPAALCSPPSSLLSTRTPKDSPPA